MKKNIVAAFLIMFSPITEVFAQAYKNNVAVCSSSKGYSYYADRNMAKGDILGWTEDTNLTGSITFKKYDDGKLDLIFTDASLGSYSSTEEGASIIPVSISDSAASIVLVYPNLSETYVFQKLKNGKFQVMWTQAKADTLLPKIAAWVADCSYLDLGSLVLKK